jgi:uncharacterized surface protein with fasciclin (FAS1) repeats
MSKISALMRATAVAAILGSAGALSPGQSISAEMTVEVGGAPMPSRTSSRTPSLEGHTTLVAAVKAAGLVDTLQGAGPFTVFAPTNDAFAGSRRHGRDSSEA